MSRNPFINCKSRKKRKKVTIVRNKPTGFCPQTLVKYEKTVVGTMWVCKMCLSCILTEHTAREHVLICNNKNLTPKNIGPHPGPSTASVENDNCRYNCHYCNREFSRKVALNKHLETHEKSNSDEEFESEEEFVSYHKPIRKFKKESDNDYIY